MKKLVFAGVLLLSVSCQQQEDKKMSMPESKAAPTETGAQQIALKDPVCGMEIGHSYTDSALVGGKTYGFCSDECKQTFLADTATYLKQ